MAWAVRVKFVSLVRCNDDGPRVLLTQLLSTLRRRFSRRMLNLVILTDGVQGSFSDPLWLRSSSSWNLRLA